MPLPLAAWDTLLEEWLLDHPTICPTDQQTVLRAARADWQLRLDQQHLDEITAELQRQHGPLTAWTDAPHRRLQLFQRRFQQAQSNFLRWQRAVEHFRRARPEPPKPKAVYRHTPVPIVQYMYAFQEDGVTQTVYNPAHTDLLRLFDAQPDKEVMRTLEVRLPVPPEYEWLQVPDGPRTRAVTWTCTIDECRPHLLRDLAEGHGHVLPMPDLLACLQPPNTEASEPEPSNECPSFEPTSNQPPKREL